MRKLACLLALIAILGAAFSWAAPAFAEEPEEEVGSFVAVAHCDIWKHSDGTWQKGLYNGKKNVTEGAAYDPKELGINMVGYRLTRVALTYPFGEDEYIAAGGRHGMRWDQFRDYYERRAVVHEVKVKSFDAATGRAVVEWRFDLEPGGDFDPWDITRPDIRERLRIPLPPGFADAVEGYRYELPVIITWYGVKKLAPNFSVELDPGCPREPVKVASAGPESWGLLAQGKTYVAEVGKTYTATVKFRAGDPVAGQDSPPYDVVVAGVHQLTGNRFYPASLRYVSGDGKISSQQGLEPEIPEDVTVHLVTFNRENAEVVAEFSWTAQADTKQLAAVINYKWPRTDPLPYTMTFYREGEAGDQYGDNVAVVPIKVLAAPDFCVTLDKDEYSADPGDKVTVKATFKLKDGHPRPETAKLAAFHIVGGSEYPVELTPVNPTDALSGDGTIEFSPGETKTYTFTVTAQDYDTKVAATINPWSVSEDADWKDNRDEALIRIRPQCTDVSVTLAKTPPGNQREGDDAILRATVRRANDGPAGAVTVRVTLTGPGVNKSTTVSLSRGASKTYSWGVKNLSPGSKTYKATVTPVGIEDCAPGNNTDSVTFSVRDLPNVTMPDANISVELIS